MSVVKSSLWFAVGTLCSRLLGVIRESVVAGVFGAGISLDAFLVANRIPNMLRELLAEGALGSAFTKVYCESRSQNKTEAAHLLRDAIIFFACLSLLVVTLGIVFAPNLVSAITHIDLKDPEKLVFYQTTVDLTRLLFPFIGMMMMASIAAGVLHERGKFFFSSLSPIALNLGYLVGAIVFASWLTQKNDTWNRLNPSSLAITGLALGVLLGGLLQTLVQFWGIRDSLISSFKSKYSRSFALSAQLKKILVLMAPMVIASSTGQINVLVNTNFATSLEIGSVTWLTFSFRLLQLPIGIFAVAVASAALPVFTKILTDKDESSFLNAGKELAKSCELIIWLMLACFSFFLFNSKDLITLVFQHGSFTALDTLNTADSLFFYSFSLVAYGLTKVLTSFYYALDKTKFAMNVGIISIVVNFVLNYIFVNQFGFTGLAMTASCVLSVNALMLAFGLKKNKLQVCKHFTVRNTLYLFISFLLALSTQWTIDQYVDLIQIISTNPKITSLIALVIKGCATLVIFLLFASMRLEISLRQGLSYIRKRRL